MESRWDSVWPRAGCAGTLPLPGWFFLDKIFGGRKFKFVKQNKIWPILRDVIILTVLSCLGGFIVGFASTDHSSRLYIYSLSISNSLFLTLGFTISGCLAIGNRWRHLAFVGAIVWAVSIFNVIFFGFPIVMWMASIVAVAIFALIGGGISLLFKHQTPAEISSNAGDERFYEEVARELQEKPMNPGLWTKAFAEMGGDDAKARALYIKYRVAQLAEEERVANLSHAEKAMLKERAIREASEKAFKKKEEQRRILIEPFTFELFKKEYRGEIPLRQYGRTEQQQMFESWQKQKLASAGFFDASSENS